MFYKKRKKETPRDTITLEGLQVKIMKLIQLMQLMQVFRAIRDMCQVGLVAGRWPNYRLSFLVYSVT